MTCPVIGFAYLLHNLLLSVLGLWLNVNETFIKTLKVSLFVRNRGLLLHEKEEEEKKKFLRFHVKKIYYIQTAVIGQIFQVQLLQYASILLLTYIT